MLSKAVLLIQVSPFVFLVIALCGCGGSETLPADGGQASPEPVKLPRLPGKKPQGHLQRRRLPRSRRGGLEASPRLSVIRLSRGRG